MPLPAAVATCGAATPACSAEAATGSAIARAPNANTASAAAAVAMKNQLIFRS
jgi:hypothetical protein